MFDRSLKTDDFYRFRNKLIRLANNFKVSKEDAEEIANDTILKALKYFDKDKGSFESLCCVILKNKLINFKRDNIDLYFVVFLDEFEKVIDSSGYSAEENEKNKLALKFIANLRLRLDSEEKDFLDALYLICETENKMLISKAAKKIKIDLLKAWDIFRRIQRKAYKNQIDEIPEIFFRRKINFQLDPEVKISEKIVSYNTDLKFTNFLKSLSSTDWKKISILYR